MMRVAFAVGESTVTEDYLDSPPREGEKVQLETDDEIGLYRVESVEWELYDDDVIVSVGLAEIAST